MSASDAKLERCATPAGEAAAPVEEPGRSSLADLLAALPASAAGADALADPFGPWPVVAGPEAAATLFEEFKAPDAIRESPVVSIPLDEEHPRRDAPQASPTSEALGPEPTPARAAPPEFEVVLNSWTATAAHVEPVRFEATDAAPASTGVPAAPMVVPADPPRVADEASGTRRAAVLSYDQVHTKRKKASSKTPALLAAAVIVVLAVAGFVGGPRIGALLKRPPKTPPTAQPAGPTAPGGFKITTQPNGSRITIDGTPRGKAPLRVDDLAPGLHSVVVESEWGTLEEAVTVESGKVTPLALATVGWIKVEAPVELEVSEEGRSYGRTTGQLMVPAGRHSFVFLNPSVAVRHRQFVQVPAGQVVKVPLDLPPGMLNLTSDQAAQVLLDGEAIGDAPQVSVPAALGPHEVIFRSPKYGDVSYSVNVTLAAPVTLRASFGAKR